MFLDGTILPKTKQDYVSCLLLNMLAEFNTRYLSHTDYLPGDHECGRLDLITCPVDKTPSFNDVVLGLCCLPLLEATEACSDMYEKISTALSQVICIFLPA